MPKTLTVTVVKKAGVFTSRWSVRKGDSAEFTADSAKDALKAAVDDFGRKSLRVRGRGRGRPTLLEQVATNFAHGDGDA